MLMFYLLEKYIDARRNLRLRASEKYLIKMHSE